MSMYRKYLFNLFRPFKKNSSHDLFPSNCSPKALATLKTTRRPDWSRPGMAKTYPLKISAKTNLKSNEIHTFIF